MRLGASYSKRERDELASVMPPGAELGYSFARNAYEIRVRPERARASKVIREIPRAEMWRWRKPLRVINHAARRALRDAGLPAEFRLT
jgi:hypothetical protein